MIFHPLSSEKTAQPPETEIFIPLLPALRNHLLYLLAYIIPLFRHNLGILEIKVGRRGHVNPLYIIL